MTFSLAMFYFLMLITVARYFWETSAVNAKRASFPAAHSQLGKRNDLFSNKLSQ